MAVFSAINSTLSRVVWGAPMLCAFLGTGLYFTLRTGFFQARGFLYWNKRTFGALLRGGKADGSAGISQWQTLTSTLAASLGTGNIIGVATALTLGGPGTIFWMWLSAALGMMTCYAENTLSILYREKDLRGPMAYLAKGLGSKGLAGCYAGLLGLAALGMGNMTQSNAVAQAAAQGLRAPLWLTGAILALLTGLLVMGGVKRLGKVTQMLVPLMTALFTLGCVVALLVNARKIPAALGLILRGAFGKNTYKNALRYGVSRGVFSNEAGLGTSGVMHAAAQSADAPLQGMWGMAEVYLDTIVMCTVTALTLLVSGAYGTGADGVGMVTAAFSGVLGVWGERLVLLCTALFAFATLSGWSYYGEEGVRYLLGKKAVPVFRVIYSVTCLLGCVLRLEEVWKFADVLNGLLAIPNLLGVLLLGKEALVRLPKKRDDSVRDHSSVRV
jgi:AGCS family alanine or glycine:cation symporter